MCDVCCKEFKGWGQSFSRTERALTLLEAVLLVLLIVLTVFLILHLLACSTFDNDAIYFEATTDISSSPIEPTVDMTTPTTKQTTKSDIISEDTTTTWIPDISSSPLEPTVDMPQSTTRKPTKPDNVSEDFSTNFIPEISTVPPKSSPDVPISKTIEADVNCTWTPSHKTIAFTHYFENGATKGRKQTAPLDLNAIKHIKAETAAMIAPLDAEVEKFESISQEYVFSESDQMDNDDKIQNQYVMALVKWRPPRDVVFGCILTIVTECWVLTAASCIEAIEQADSLDSFVIVEEYGTSSNGKIHSIFDLQIHPLYGGVNESFDVAALKSDSILMNMQAAELPSVLDHSLITIGERFNILGFENSRSSEDGGALRNPRRVRVYTLPAARCGRRAGRAARAGRHLVPAGDSPTRPAAGGVPPLCAGALAAHSGACHAPCGGTPLLRGGTLLGVLSGGRRGGACHPRRYVSIAAPAIRAWIDDLLHQE